MKQTVSLLMALALAPAVVPSATAADAVDGNALIEAHLAERGIEHVVDEDGDFQIVYAWAREERSQLVYVAGRSNQINGLVVREVFAPAARIPAGGLDAETANRLLLDSQRKVLGSWEASGDLLLYVIKLPENMDAATLETALGVAAETADNMEIELTGGKDEF